MNGFKNSILIILWLALTTGLVSPNLAYSKDRVALIVKYAGNVRINGALVSDNQWVLDYNDTLHIEGKEAYLVVLPVHLPHRDQDQYRDTGVIKLDEKNAGEKAGPALNINETDLSGDHNAKNPSWPEHLVAVLTTKARSSSILIARKFSHLGLWPVFPMHLDDFYGLSGKRLCFRWVSLPQYSRTESYKVSIIFPDGRKFGQTVSNPGACFTIDRQSCNFLNWRVQALSSNMTLEGKCYLGDRRDLFIDIEQAECMVQLENSVSTILARADCLLQNELEYEAYMTLKNGSVKFPDVTLFSKLVDQMEKSRQ
jgi:hypothetical protein